jgi:hypothetical protein
MVWGGFLVGDDKKSEKEPIIVKAQLPRYFKQLGLSDKQRQDIFKARAKYAVEIEKLTKQITALREQEKRDIENVLTDAQKARLRELLSGVGGKKDTETTEKPAPVGSKK